MSAMYSVPWKQNILAIKENVKMLVLISILLFGLAAAFIVLLAATMLSSQISRMETDYLTAQLMLEQENIAAQDEDI